MSDTELTPEEREALRTTIRALPPMDDAALDRVAALWAAMDEQHPRRRQERAREARAVRAA